MSNDDFNYEQRPLTDEYLEGYEGIKWDVTVAEEEDKKESPKKEEVGYGR